MLTRFKHPAMILATDNAMLCFRLLAWLLSEHMPNVVVLWNTFLIMLLLGVIVWCQVFFRSSIIAPFEHWKEWLFNLANQNLEVG